MRTRLAGGLGLAWGAMLFVYPDDVWRRLAGRGCDADERFVTQVLGVRHLGQGAAEVLAPRVLRRPSALVDATHALSMVALAARRREYARPTLASAAVALGGATLARRGRRR